MHPTAEHTKSGPALCLPCLQIELQGRRNWCRSWPFRQNRLRDRCNKKCQTSGMVTASVYHITYIITYIYILYHIILNIRIISRKYSMSLIPWSMEQHQLLICTLPKVISAKSEKSEKRMESGKLCRSGLAQVFGDFSNHLHPWRQK